MPSPWSMESNVIENFHTCYGKVNHSIYLQWQLQIYQYWIKCFKHCPLIGSEEKSPSKFYRKNIFFPFTSCILNGPNQILSNFPCLPFSCILASHFSTKFPWLKTLCLAFISNKLSILSLYCDSLTYACSISYSSSIIWCTLLVKSFEWS